MEKMGVVGIAMIGLLSSLVSAQGGLKLGFYEQSCPKAEKIIKDYVSEHIPNTPTLAAPLLRMHFHDCFVRGCDGSILLNLTKTNPANATEKVSPANTSLRGFDFIDRIKSLLEAACPSTVSCADVLALTTRDAVGVIGGPFWNVPTGRRDGTVSNFTEALNNIPSPFFNLSRLVTSFASKGLNVTDLVLLSGGHTIGISQCSSFSNRLFNFTGRGDQDPDLDSEYAANLKANKCKLPNDATTFVEMDPGSFTTFDLEYYKLVLKRRGLFTSDSALTTSSATRDLVARLVDAPISEFFAQFAAAMEKMGRIEVKTGSEGEIRKNCALVNN